MMSLSPYNFRTLKALLIRLSLILGVSLLPLRTAWAAQEASMRKVYLGEATRSADVYAEPDSRSRIVGRVGSGESVSVLTQTAKWYRLLIGEKEGWISKSFVKLNGETRLLPKRKIARETDEPEESEDEKLRNAPSVRAFLGPVFSLHRYGATQLKLGVIADIYELNDRFGFGVPVTFARGGGFSTVQGGVEVSVRLFERERFLCSARVSPLFEWLYGNGRSFWALTVDAGPVLQYRLSPSAAITLEPFTVEYSPYTSNSIGAFWRGQVLAGGRWVW